MKLIELLFFALRVPDDLVFGVTGGLANFFHLYEKIQPVGGGIPAVDNRHLGEGAISTFI